MRTAPSDATRSAAARAQQVARQQRQVACHQAGHAIVAWALGLGVSSIEMVGAEEWEEALGGPPGCSTAALEHPDLFGKVRILFRARDRWELHDPLPMMLFALGGPAAEIVHRYTQEQALERLLERADPGDDFAAALDRARERVAGGEIVTGLPEGPHGLPPRKLELLERNARVVLASTWTSVLSFLRAHEEPTLSIAEELLRVRKLPGRELHRLCGAWNEERGRYESTIDFEPYLPQLPRLVRVRKSLAEFVSPVGTRSTRPPRRGQ